MKSVILSAKRFASINKMTSRQQILVYLAVLSLKSLDKTKFEPYDKVDDIHEMTGLSPGTIKDSLHVLMQDEHL